MLAATGPAAYTKEQLDSLSDTRRMIRKLHATHQTDLARFYERWLLVKQNLFHIRNTRNTPY